MKPQDTNHNNINDHVQRVISMYAHSDHTPAVEADIQSWLADDTLRDQKDQALDALWSEVMAAPQASRSRTSQAWKRFVTANRLNPATPYVTLSRRLRIWQAAAAILTLITLGSIFLMTRPVDTPDIIQQHTAVATVNTFLLPDGTEVLLNSGSTLIYPDRFTGDQRCVYLIGQGNFKVHPDKAHPFIVKTDNFQVTALGTEFDINAYPDLDEITATLLEGSVKVEYSNLTGKAVLYPGQQLVFNKRTQQATLNHSALDDVTAWQHGDLALSNLTVPEILRTIERKYNYRFAYSPAAFADDRYTFRFSSSAPLQEVMSIISDVSGGHVRYQINGRDCQVTYDQHPKAKHN